MLDKRVHQKEVLFGFVVLLSDELIIKSFVIQLINCSITGEYFFNCGVNQILLDKLITFSELFNGGTQVHVMKLATTSSERDNQAKGEKIISRSAAIGGPTHLGSSVTVTLCYSRFGAHLSRVIRKLRRSRFLFDEGRARTSWFRCHVGLAPSLESACFFHECPVPRRISIQRRRQHVLLVTPGSGPQNRKCLFWLFIYSHVGPLVQSILKL